METSRIVVPEAEDILNRYFPALDYGFVALVDYMGGDLSIERAARCSYEIGPKVRDIKDTRHLIRFLWRNEHASPFEHAEISVHMAMPIFVARQFVRHRTAHLNEYSGRYSRMPMLFYTPGPDDVCYQSADNKQGRAGRVDAELYAGFIDMLERNRECVKGQYRVSLSRDIAKETARIDLPLSTYTYWYWKCDLRNIFHLIGLRSDPHAQKEIRVYSDILAGIARRVAPIAFDAFQDYQLDSVSFSQAEMAAIRFLCTITHASPLIWDNPPEEIRSQVDGYLRESFGVAGREAAEFWRKIKPRHKRNFALDPFVAHDAAYYRDLVEDHAVGAGATS